MGRTQDSWGVAPAGFQCFRTNRLEPDAPASTEYKTVSDLADFPENHAGKCSIDFFTVPTASFNSLFVLVILRHSRRKVVHFNVTSNPSGQWTAQQVVEAFPWETVPKYLIRDRDSVYGVFFLNRVNSMGTKEVISAPQSPWQNPFVERMIGSIRRECTGHVIVLNEAHLTSVLCSYLEYYHNDRTHLSLEKGTPCGRLVQPRPAGKCKIIALPRVG